MAHDTNELIKKSLKLIKEKKLFFMSDVYPLLGISERTWYNHKLQEVQEIKEALTYNKIEVKSSMRSKWYQSDNPTLQMGLYKLLGSEEEYHRLANTKIDVTSREEVPIFKGIDISVKEDGKKGEE